MENTFLEYLVGALAMVFLWAFVTICERVERRITKRKARKSDSNGTSVESDTNTSN